MKKEKIGEWNTIVYLPSEDSGWKYVISYDDGNGGAVISDKDYNKAKASFIEAMTVGKSILKLMKFSKTGKF